MDSDFSFVTFKKLVFLLFRQVPKACHHLMPNPSWDGSQWCNIKILKMKKISLYGGVWYTEFWVIFVTENSTKLQKPIFEGEIRAISSVRSLHSSQLHSPH